MTTNTTNATIRTAIISTSAIPFPAWGSFCNYATSAGLTRVITLTVPIETRTITTTTNTSTNSSTSIAITSTSAIPLPARSGCLFYLRHLS